MGRKIAGLSLNVFLLGVVSLITDISSEMISPVFPMFIAFLGGTGLIVGLIGGAGDFTASLLNIFSGYWSDKIGKRKGFVFSGYFLSSLTKTLFALSTSWIHLLLLKPLERVGKGLRTSPRDALISESAEKKVRGKAFGLHTAMDTTGAILGSLLSFLLIYFLTWEMRQVILLGGLIGFIALVPLVFVHERKGLKRKIKELSLRISLRKLPKNLQIYILVASLFSLSNFTYMFFILRAQDFFTGKLALSIPILFYVWFNIIYAFLSIPTGVLSDRIGRAVVLFTGYLLYGLSCLALTTKISTLQLFIAFTLYGLSYAFFDGTQRAFVSDLSEAEVRGTALGTFHTSASVMALVSSILAGAIYSYISPAATFLFAALVALTAAMLLILFVKTGKI